MEVGGQNALWTPRPEFIFDLCSDGSEHGPNVEEIEKLIAAFCTEELPPNQDDRHERQDQLFFNYLRNPSHKAFLVDSEPSKKLREELMINLDCIKTRGYDPIEVYCYLVQGINGRRHEQRKHINGRSFASGAREKHGNDGSSEELKIQERPQRSTDPPTDPPMNPPVSHVHKEALQYQPKTQKKAGFAWKDVAFNIDVKACSGAGIDQIWVLFSETVDCRCKSRPYTEEDFDVKYLKTAITADPDLSDLDIKDKYFWQEDLQQPFRLVQSDMLVLLKAFSADKNLHKPRPWIQVRLLSRVMDKRRRESTTEAEINMEDEPAPKKRNTGHKTSHVAGDEPTPKKRYTGHNTRCVPEDLVDFITVSPDDSTDSSTETEEETDDEFVPPVSSRTRKAKSWRY